MCVCVTDILFLLLSEIGTQARSSSSYKFSYQVWTKRRQAEMSRWKKFSCNQSEKRFSLSSRPLCDFSFCGHNNCAHKFAHARILILKVIFVFSAITTRVLRHNNRERTLTRASAFLFICVGSVDVGTRARYQPWLNSMLFSSARWRCFLLLSSMATQVRGVIWCDRRWLFSTWYCVQYCRVATSRADDFSLCLYY